MSIQTISYTDCFPSNADVFNRVSSLASDQATYWETAVRL